MLLLRRNDGSERVLPRQYHEAPSAERRDDHRRLFLEPEPLLPHQLPVRGSVREYDPSIRIPMAEYAETGGSRRALGLGIGIGILVLAMVGGMASWAFFGRGDGLAYWQRFNAMIHRERIDEKFDAMIYRAWHRDAASSDARRENARSGVDGSSSGELSG